MLTPIRWGDSMQKVALAMVLVIGSITLGGCFVGKGKVAAAASADRS